MTNGSQRIRSMHRWLLISALVAASPVRANDPATDWDFAVMLDSRPIGTHRFELATNAADMQSLTSDARFEVKLLGFTVYRYQHLARERWQGECLSQVSARTDDDGTITVVDGRSANGDFLLSTSHGSKPLQGATPGCVASFAYWNPQLLARQRQLLDPGSGRIESVTITRLPATTIEVRGAPTLVTGLRISGLKAPIDVWYANDRWVGLDTAADGRRKLTYRLP